MSTKTMKMSFALVLATHFMVGAQEASPETALRFVESKATEWGLTLDDVSELAITDHYTSSTSGLMHVYLRQQFNGVPVFGGLADVHLKPNGKIFLEHHSALLPNLRSKIETFDPSLTQLQAIYIALEILGHPLKNHNTFQEKKDGASSLFFFGEERKPEHTLHAAPAYESDQNGKLRLSWNIALPADENNDVWQIRIDAATGEELSRNNQTVHCQYYETPMSDKPLDAVSNQFLEHPSACKHPTGAALNHGPAPIFSFNEMYNVFALPTESPTDGIRSLKSGNDIINLTASPYRWHDTDVPGSTPEFNYTKGNNVYAFYAPLTAGANPPAVCFPFPFLGNVPCSNTLNFNYNNAIGCSTGASTLSDAVANLFVWNNLCHDIFYLYGFDEAAGNFQTTNISGLGQENDHVLARAQDGTGSSNASFSTPADGSSPTMRMFNWNANCSSPNYLDGDFDNGIITHEYGHGVTFRLVGGPSNVSCLNSSLSSEQGGEGWSDFFALLFTTENENGTNGLEENVLGEGIRSIGSYVIGQSENGTGIRPRYYTTEMSLSANYHNEFTYGDLGGLAVPHGVGFLWCTMLWDMNWALINEYGFEPDIYNTASTAGNIRAFKIVMEALTMTPCQPDFIEMRDAVLAANDVLYGGDGKYEIWAAFARRGLGFSASAGGNEAFDNPTMQVTKTVDKENADIGESVTYTITIKNNHDDPLTSVNISDPVPANLVVTLVSDDGSVVGGSVVYPTIATLNIGQSITRTFTGTINAATGTTEEYDNPVETATPPDFSTVNGPSWITSTDSPNPNSSSTRSWFHLDPVASIDESLELTLPNLNQALNYHLSFWQSYSLEANVDGGVLEIWDGGIWKDLGGRIKKNGYSSVLYDALPNPIGPPVAMSALSGRRAFTGDSGGYIQTIVDLSGYASPQKVRFRIATNSMNPGCSTPCNGWFLDDFLVYDLKNMLNTANAVSAQGFAESGNVGQIGTIYFQSALVPVELTWFSAKALQKEILLEWTTAAERNNAGFRLQRRSEFENEFKDLAWVEGMGNSALKNEYRFLDKEVQPNVVYYYRLASKDFDGGEKISDIVYAVVFSDPKDVAVYPNPASGTLFFKFQNKVSERLKIEIMDATGKIITVREFEPGQSQYSTDIAGLLPNLYVLKIFADDHVTTKKLMVIHQD